MDQQIVDYIRDGLRKGYAEAELRNVLRGSGWLDADIDRAFAEARGADARPPAPPLSAPFTTEGLASVPDLFSEAAKTYASRLWTLVGVYLGYIVLLIPIFILFLIAFGVGLAGGLRGGTAGIAAIGGTLAVVVLIAVPYVIIVASWWTASMIFAIKDSAERIGVIESFRRGWGRAFTMLLTIILQALCCLLALVPAGVLMFAASLMRSGAGLFLIPAAVVAAIVPITLIAVWLSMSPVVVVAEGSSAVGALARSKALVERYWWGVFFRFIVLMIAVVMVYVIPLGFILVLGRIIGGPAALLLMFLSNIVQIVLGIIVTPFCYVYLYTVYVSLRRVKG